MIGFGKSGCACNCVFNLLILIFKCHFLTSPSVRDETCSPLGRTWMLYLDPHELPGTSQVQCNIGVLVRDKQGQGEDLEVRRCGCKTEKATYLTHLESMHGLDFLNKRQYKRYVVCVVSDKTPEFGS